MWFISVEVEQETSAPLPEKNPGSAPVPSSLSITRVYIFFDELYILSRASLLALVESILYPLDWHLSL